MYLDISSGACHVLRRVLLWNARFIIERKEAAQQEALRLVEINLTLITPSNCELCVDGKLLLEAVEKQNVRILISDTFSADSDEGKALIKTYGSSACQLC